MIWWGLVPPIPLEIGDLWMATAKTPNASAILGGDRYSLGSMHVARSTYVAEPPVKAITCCSRLRPAVGALCCLSASKRVLVSGMNTRPKHRP